MSETHLQTDQPIRPPVIVSLDSGEPITPFGLDMRVLIRSSDTGGTFSAILAAHEPGKGPIHHRHAHQDEYFLIVEGRYEVSINKGEPRICEAGTLLYVPAGNIHAFKNVGTTTAKVLDWSIPGGQDEYFREISDLQAGNGFDGGAMDAVNRKHHTEYLG